PQNAPANWPQTAPVVSASSPNLTARRTASSKVAVSWKAHNDASRLLTTQPDRLMAGGCWWRKLPCAARDRLPAMQEKESASLSRRKECEESPKCGRLMTQPWSRMRFRISWAMPAKTNTVTLFIMTDMRHVGSHQEQTSPRRPLHVLRGQ